MYAQVTKAAPDDSAIGVWKVSLTLDSEPARPVEIGYTKFTCLKVAEDGNGELSGKTDSNQAEYRHRDFSAISTLGVANKDGVMEVDMEFASNGMGSGKVVWRGIAKRDGSVLLIALGRAWSESRPQSFDDVMTVANQKTDAKHAR